MPLRLKLVLWYTAVLGLSGSLLVGGLYALIGYRLHSEADRLLAEEHAEWVEYTREHIDDLAAIEEAIATEAARETYVDFAYRLRDTEQNRDLLFLANPHIARGYAAELRECETALRAPPVPTFTTVRVRGGKRSFRVLTGPVDRDASPHLTVQVAMYTRRLNKRFHSLRKYLVLVLVSMVLLAASGGWFLAAKSLKPIDQIVAELESIESRNLADRLRVGESGDEVDRLRAAINRMLERLGAAFERLRMFTADAAHEFRTPLATLQCRLEVALDSPDGESDPQAALTEALQQVAQLDALVDNLLLLARMDAVPQLQDREVVGIASLLRDVAEPFGLLADQKGVSLSAECECNVQVEGARVLLRDLLGNLLDNAVRYTPSGGRVDARAAREEGEVVITVSDTGIGIGPEALEHIFERFYRTDESRSRDVGGAGIGLSIVKRVVELHRGRIAVQSSLGAGTTVQVCLPQAPPDAAPQTVSDGMPGQAG